MKKAFLLLLILLFVSQLTAQNNEVRVEEFSIKGKLSKEDPFKPELGRFDGIELYLKKGDMISIDLVSDFIPLLAFVTPSNKYVIEYPEDASTYIHYVTTIDENGTWYLSIVGDSLDFGNYELIYRYASATSMNANKASDLCESLDFFLEHVKADFFFLKKSVASGQIEKWVPKVNFNGAARSAIIDSEEYGTWYEAEFYNGADLQQATAMQDSLIGTINKCFGHYWKVSNYENKQDNVLEKRTRFDEQAGKKRFMRVALYETTDTNSKKKNYKVELVINRARS